MAVAESPSDQASVSLRPEADEDVPFLYALYASTRVEELAVVPWTAEEKESFLRFQFAAQRRHYLEHYSGPDTHFDVIVRDGRPIGRWYVTPLEGGLQLVDVALLPEHRNAGIGTALMEELLDRARRRRCRVTLHVEPFNPAKRLYERLGFHDVEQHGVYTFMEWRPEEHHRGDPVAKRPASDTTGEH